MPNYSKSDQRLGLRRLTMLEVMIHGMDYLYPVAVCYRLQPSLRPQSFRQTIRTVTPKHLDSLLASELLTGNMTHDEAASMRSYRNITGE